MRKVGFTLVELVVVILIIAILAVVAVPRLMGTRRSAQDSALVESLSAVRTAIGMYTSEHNGALPGSTGTKDAAQFVKDIEAYLRQPFPACPVGAAAGKEAEVLMTTKDPLVGTGTADEGWAFNSNTGDFIVNSDGPMVINPNINYDSL